MKSIFQCWTPVSSLGKGKQAREILSDRTSSQNGEMPLTTCQVMSIVAVKDYIGIFITLSWLAVRFDLEPIRYVVNAFVHAKLDERGFMKLPPGYRKPGTIRY